jgi:hypothetical protein
LVCVVFLKEFEFFNPFLLLLIDAIVTVMREAESIKLEERYLLMHEGLIRLSYIKLGQTGLGQVRNDLVRLYRICQDRLVWLSEVMYGKASRIDLTRLG